MRPTPSRLTQPTRLWLSRMRWIVPIALIALVLGTSAMDRAFAKQQSATVVRPATIHGGTCAKLGEQAIVDLSDVVSYDTDPPGTPTGATTAAPVFISQTRIDTSLTDLLSKPNAIQVLESAGSTASAACGEIGGVTIDGQLLVGMKPQGDSSITGVAQLVADGDATMVTILLTDIGASRAGAATPVSAATPVAADEAVPTEEAAPPADEAPACDTSVEDCDGDGVVDDLEGGAVCDTSVEDCDGDGVVDDFEGVATCDTSVEDCNGDGVVDDLEGPPGTFCDPYVTDCDGDGFVDIPS